MYLIEEYTNKNLLKQNSVTNMFSCLAGYSH